MKNNLLIQKESEQHHANILIDWFRKTHNKKFVIAETEPEYSDVDITLVNTETSQKIPLQCTEYRGRGTQYQNINIQKEIPINGKIEFFNAKLTFMNVPSDLDHKNGIEECIRSKENHYMSSKQLNTLVLIIEIMIPDLTLEILNRLALHNVETKFKACYLVQYPFSAHPNAGYVYELKALLLN